MHANNEMGNLLDINRVGELCDQYRRLLPLRHGADAWAITAHNLSTLKVHGMTAAAHKFHGPKGVGFMFIRKDKKIQPFMHGGAQERNMRGGTENVYGIIGLAKALEIAYRDMSNT